MWGLGFEVWGELIFRVWVSVFDFGLKVWSVYCAGVMVKGVGVWGLRLRECSV